MYLVPFIRINRAFASTLLLPNEPIKAIAISETVSVFGPFLNPYMYKKIINMTIILMYIPNYSSYLLEHYKNENLKYNQAEICCILLFNLILIFNF